MGRRFAGPASLARKKKPVHRPGLGNGPAKLGVAPSREVIVVLVVIEVMRPRGRARFAIRPSRHRGATPRSGHARLLHVQCLGNGLPALHDAASWLHAASSAPGASPVL